MGNKSASVISQSQEDSYFSDSSSCSLVSCRALTLSYVGPIPFSERRMPIKTNLSTLIGISQH